MTVSFKSPPLVAQENIDQAASQLAVSFPSDYASFLLTTNGGVPKPAKLLTAAGEFKINRFYSLAATQPKKPLDLVSNLVHMNIDLRDGDSSLGLPDGYLAIGLVDDTNFLVMAVRGEHVGAISSWSSEPSAFGPGLTPLVNSFASLLHQLEHPSDEAMAIVKLKKQYDKFEDAIFNKRWAKAKEMFAQLDMTHWAPTVHPIFSAISDRDVDAIRQLHQIGVSFAVEDWGKSPLQSAETQAKHAAEEVERLEKSKSDATSLKNWKERSSSSHAIAEYLRQHGLN